MGEIGAILAQLFLTHEFAERVAEAFLLRSP
jgi:hypothetical protein